MKAISFQKVASIPDTGSSDILYLINTVNGLNVATFNDGQDRICVANRKTYLSGPNTLFFVSQGAGAKITWRYDTGVYVIQNYSSFETYDVSVSEGSVVVSGNTITVTIPNSPTQPLERDLFLKINKEVSKIKLIQAGAAKSTLLYPYFKTPGGFLLDPLSLPLSFTVISSAFSSVNVGETCVKTQIQIAKDDKFTDSVQNFENTGEVSSYSLTSIYSATEAYIRHRYVGSLKANTTWSDPVKISIYNAEFAPLSEISQMTPASLITGNNYGANVKLSLNGQRLAVAAPYVDSKGAVYVYKNDGDLWILEQKLQPATLAVNSDFGYSLAISDDGNVLAVGISSTATRPGSVVMYTHYDSTWIEAQTFQAPSPSNQDGFGSCLSLNESGTIIAISSEGEDTTVTNSGAVYLYYQTNYLWLFKQKIKQASPNSTDRFGYSCEISGDGTRLAVGLINRNAEKGAVFIYLNTADVWAYETELIPVTTPSSGAFHFGKKMSMNRDGSFLAVSGPDYNKGMVVVFYRSTGWNNQYPIYPDLSSASSKFGDAVKIDKTGSYLLIGDPGYLSNQGRAMRWKIISGTYYMQEAYANIDPGPGELFGQSVAWSSDFKTVIIGNPGHSSAKGVVSVFR